MSKEIIFPAKMQFAFQEYEDESLKQGEIRGRTLTTLVSQGTEIGWAQGDKFPIRPGYAAVFQVEEIGPGVKGVELGEHRFCMGYHRSTQLHSAADTLPVPKGMPAEHAVLARLMGVSMTTLMTTSARPGDRVIISGAGPVGFLAAHLFRIGGYRVTVVDPDAPRRAQMATTGITDCYERIPLTDTAFLGQVALVVDCSGHEAAVLDACNIVRKNGEVVLVGVPWRKLSDVTAHELLRSVFFNFVNLRSGWEWQIPIHARGFVWEELLQGYNNAPHSTFTGFQHALRWLDEGKIPLKGLIHLAVPSCPETLYTDIMSRKIVEPFIAMNWTAF